MKEIFHVLTPRHFNRGLPLYGRAHLPFFVHAGYAAGVILLTMHLPADWFAAAGARLRLPEDIGGIIMTFVAGAAFYGAGFFPIRRLVRRWEEGFQSRVLRAQFGLLQRMARLGQAAAVFLLCDVVWLFSGRTVGEDETWAPRAVAVGLTVVMATVVALVVAFHGWMADQLADIGGDGR